MSKYPIYRGKYRGNSAATVLGLSLVLSLGLGACGVPPGPSGLLVARIAVEFES